MLSTQSTRAANDLARRLSNRVKIMPKRSTLLDELQVASHNCISLNSIENSDHIVSIVATDNSVVCSGSVVESSRHDTIMDAYIDDIAKAASAHVMFNKTVVNKCVGAFRDELMATFNQFKRSVPEEVFEVSYFKPADVFSSQELLDEVNGGGGYGFSELKASDYFIMGLAVADAHPIETYLLTGDESFDAYISKWISSVGKDRLNSYVFTMSPDSFLPIETVLDYCLANYLFYRNLSIKLDINVGLTTVQLKVKANVLKNFYTTYLNRSLKEYTRFVSVGQLLSPVSDVSFRQPSNGDKLRLIVLNDTFDKFIEGGGSLECLFGYIADENSTNKTYKEILGNQTRYLDAWKTVRSMYTIKANNSRLDNFKTAISIAYDKLNMTLADGEEEARVANPNYHVKVDKALDKYMASLTLSSIDNLDDVCISVIAGIRYNYTNAYVFLVEMNNMLKMSDKITVEEAALFASMRYITEYMMGQTYIVK